MFTINKTKNLNLCISCEICCAICPKEAIKMEYVNGQFLPKINEKCNLCGLCGEICPGIDIDPLNFRKEIYLNKPIDGDYIGAFTVSSKNISIQKSSTSGGAITSLIVNLIKDKEYDSAFVLPFDMFEGSPARLTELNDIQSICNAAKSKYIPASVYNVIKTIKKYNNKKFIIVGTPCQLVGIKKYITKLNISSQNFIFFGLFCDNTLNFNIIKYYQQYYAKNDEKLIKIDFRNKENHGWPGDTKLYFDSGREIFINRKVRIDLKPYFKLNRCLVCLNGKLNPFADISFGDCYIQEEHDLNGKSNIIIRTLKGKEIFDNYEYLFDKKKESIHRIRDSQNINSKIENFENLKILNQENNIFLDVTYEKDTKFLKKYLKAQNKIEMSKKSNFRKINAHITFNKFLININRIFMFSIGGLFLINRIIKDLGNKANSNNNKNILILGGGLFNKGAQAMTFTTVDQLRRKYPDKKIYLFSEKDFNRPNNEKNIYKFNFLPINLIIRVLLIGTPAKYFNSYNIDSYTLKEIENVFKDGFCCVDISGYALSSQWGLLPSLSFILNLIIAKKYSIPFYILPQSFGPFNYSLKYKFILMPLIRLYFRYPKKIYVREHEGFNVVSNFNKNTEKSLDIVLQNSSYNFNNIYVSKKVNFKDIDIPNNSIGIIPNSKVFERTNNKLYYLYRDLIKICIKSKKVYLIHHSHEDLSICKKIKEFFIDDNNVIVITEELNSIELENTITKFDFIIGSRYHSIIHAYKNGIPALVIGWATKYFELMKTFNQLDYYFDSRYLDEDKIKFQLNNLIVNYKQDKKEIKAIKELFNKNEIFKHIS